MAMTAFVLLVSCFIQCESNDDDLFCDCPDTFAPSDIVCGENEIQYLSACEAECSGINYTAGPCPTKRDAVILDLGDPALDGCGWVTRITFGNQVRDYSPDSIPAELMVDQLEISLKYYIGESQQTCGLTRVIKEIEVVEMSAR